MRFVAEHFHLVTLPEVDGFLRGEGDVPARAVAITFDDGFRDNYEIAAHDLQRWKVPAAFYVTVGLAGSGQPPWFLRLRFAFNTTSCKWSRDALSRRCWPLTEALSKREAFLSASQRCAVLPTEERDAFLDDIEQDLHALPARRFAADDGLGRGAGFARGGTRHRVAYGAASQPGPHRPRSRIWRS